MKIRFIIILSFMFILFTVGIAGAQQIQCGGEETISNIDVAIAGAQAEDLQSIVNEYCADVALTVADTQQELIDAYQQGGGCVGEVQSCMEDLSRFDSASRCLRVFSQCAKHAQKAQLSACTGFLGELKTATEIAGRSAKRNHVVVGFNNWIQGDSSIEPTSGDCLTEAYNLTEECYE